MKFDVGFFTFHLCLQVTTLVNTSNKGPSNKKRGRSKKAHVLAASVEQATENFLDKGDKIAKESQFLKEELVAAVEDVRKQGKSVDLVASQTCSAEQGEPFPLPFAALPNKSVCGCSAWHGWMGVGIAWPK